MGTRKKGFTLIELLVVIAIIAILAAILFPVFARVKATAQKAACQSNLKQVASACLLYEGDNPGLITPGLIGRPGDVSDWVNMDQMWVNLIVPYVRMAKRHGTTTDLDLRGVYTCPARPYSAVLAGGATPEFPTGSELPKYLQRCYGYNNCYLGGHWDRNKLKFVYHTPAEVNKPTKTIRFMEGWNFDDGDHNDGAYGRLYSRGRGTMFCYPPVAQPSVCMPDYCWPPGWHDGGTTVAWFDGHVSIVKCAPPQLPGGTATANPFTGIMQQYYQNTTNAGWEDPYFRLTAPKP